MKGNIGKLAVFVIVATIATFIPAAMALAGEHDQNAIRGRYAFTGGYTCLLAPFGFNPNLTPVNGLGIISINNREGIYTFENDGTGSFTANGSSINFSYIGPSGPVPPSAASSKISADFTYTVTDDGIITITIVPGTYFVTFTSGPNNGATYRTEGGSSVKGTVKGTITPDGKNITISTDASNLFTLIGPNLPPIASNQSCSGSVVLIWQHDEEL